MESVFDRLRGGDLRSTGGADQVAREAVANPCMVAALITGLQRDEPIVRMRCADALEKVTRVRPEYLEAVRDTLPAMIGPAQPKELLWHLLQMVPRLRWEGAALARVFAAVQACLSSSSSIVKVCAMQALFELVQQAPARRGEVGAIIAEGARTGTPAMKARAAKLLRALAG